MNHLSVVVILLQLLLTSSFRWIASLPGSSMRSLSSKINTQFSATPSSEAFIYCQDTSQINIFEKRKAAIFNRSPDSIRIQCKLHSEASKKMTSPIAENRNIFVISDTYNADENTELARKQCAFTFYLPEHDTLYYKNLSGSEFDTLLDKRIWSLISPQSTLNNRLKTDAGIWSNFLSLSNTEFDTQEFVEVLPSLRKGVDAFEIRIDLLQYPSIQRLSKYYTLLRDATGLPIIWTLRSKSQFGAFEGDVNQMVEILREGVRLGVDWIDIESNWKDEPVMKTFIDEVSSIGKYSPVRNTEKGIEISSKVITSRPKRTRIIGSSHTSEKLDSTGIKSKFESCQLDGRADILKLVTDLSNETSIQDMHIIGDSLSDVHIGISMGKDARESRILNKRFTPVTHAWFPVKAFPSQLTAEELTQERIARGLVEPKQYHLIGSNISYSLSPQMHMASFDALSLPHNYTSLDSDFLPLCHAAMSTPDFAGASITIPYKEEIAYVLDRFDSHVSNIGACNTVHRDSEKSLTGYNTDWLGIRRPIQKFLLKQWWHRDRSTEISSRGLVLGAGGTARAACYALKTLRFNVTIANRNEERGNTLANNFASEFVPLSSLSELKEQYDVIISTLPANSGIEYPDNLFKNKPIVFDVVYKPYITPLLQKALEKGCDIVSGASMLLEQAIEQFELWNDRKAPALEMERILQKALNITAALRC